ncbi:hypothetical protein P8452_02699 [Trifolium repens]|nr:hypothetical protein P8452_02699 [Trifolium repens]
MHFTKDHFRGEKWSMVDKGFFAGLFSIFRRFSREAFSFLDIDGRRNPFYIYSIKLVYEHSCQKCIEWISGTTVKSVSLLHNAYIS